MKLEQLAEDVESLVNGSINLTEGFIHHRDTLVKNVNAGLRGRVEAQEEIKSMREVYHSQLTEKANSLKKKIEAVRENELKAIEDTSEPLTADIAAELELISKVKFTNKELKGYYEKYKRNPLAIKKLNDIAYSKGLHAHTAQAPQDREKALKRVIGGLESHISRFSTIQDQGDRVTKIKMNMIADGAIKGISKDVAAYRKLK